VPLTRSGRYHHGDLRNAMLDAVGEVLRIDGLGALSVRRAARRLGVSHAAPTHHFRNRTVLLSAFAAQGFERLLAAIRARTRGARSGPAMLEAVGRAYIEFALREPERFSVMFRSELLDEKDPELRRASDAAYGSLTEAMGRCVAERWIRPEDAARTGLAAWSMVHGYATLWLGGRPPVRSGRAEARRMGGDLARWFTENAIRGKRGPGRRRRARRDR
jgi:AcrR family transcriptional regulator